MLVFAYGSNLHDGDRRRLGDKPGYLRPHGVALLPDRRLAFTRFSTGRHGGVRDAVAAQGVVLPGLVEVASPEGLAWLDDKEGVTFGHYRRVDVTALTPDGGAVTVAVYEVVAPLPFVDPEPRYLELVREARRGLGFADDALDDAAGDRPARPLARIFLYGTLMAGERNAAQLDGARVVRRRRAKVRGTLVDCGRYPALLPSLGTGDGDDVFGELIDVHPDDLPTLLARLDPFEGFAGWARPQGSLYERRLMAVALLDEEEGHNARPPLERLAWVYIRPGARTAADDAARIVGGDWRRRET